MRTMGLRAKHGIKRTCNDNYRMVTRSISMAMLVLLILLSHDTAILTRQPLGAVSAFVPLTTTARRSSFVPGSEIITHALKRSSNVGRPLLPPSWGTTTKRDSVKLRLWRKIFRSPRGEDSESDDDSLGGGDSDGGQKDDDNGDKEEELSVDEKLISQTDTTTKDQSKIPFFANLVSADSNVKSQKDNDDDAKKDLSEADVITSQATTTFQEQSTTSTSTESPPSSTITTSTNNGDSSVVVSDNAAIDNKDDVELAKDEELIPQIDTSTLEQSITLPPIPSGVNGDGVVGAEIDDDQKVDENEEEGASKDDKPAPQMTTTVTLEQPKETSSSSIEIETLSSSTGMTIPSDESSNGIGDNSNGNDQKDSDNEKTSGQSEDNGSTRRVGATALENSPLPSTESPTKSTLATPPSKAETPLFRAQQLRAQAKRVRLEAERMDVMLTLDKISKLEVELGSQKVLEDQERREVLQGQMKELKKRLGGGDDNDESGVKNDDDVAAPSGSTSSIPGESSTATPVSNIDTATELSGADLQERVEVFEKIPKFMQKVVAGAAGLDTEDFNITELVLRIYEDELKDLDTTTMNKENGEADAPEFSQEEIEDAVQELQNIPKFIKSILADESMNDTEIAVKMLKEDSRPSITQEEIDKKLGEMKWMPSFMRGDNETKLAIDLIEVDKMMDGDETLPLWKKSSPLGEDGSESSAQNDTAIPIFNFLSDRFGPEIGTPTENIIEGAFPKECRREGEEPTEAQLKIVLDDILAKDNTWTTNNQQPEKVPGGYIIRGSTKYDNGGDLVEALDANMVTSRIRDRVSLFYIFDPTPVTEEQQNTGDRPPVLYLMGPQVTNDPTPLRSGLVSVVGVVTLWSSAIYPFLLNDKYMKLVDEQVALSDASMPSNIDFINEMAYPIFVASLGIYFAHELAHKVVADANGMNITFPTLIPSFVTGITGSVTSFTAPPKSKQDLLDFAIVGPLAGMTVSVLLLFLGITITASTGAEAYANLPSLSLSVLRQSSLAGGIMDAVIPGILNIPDAAGSTKPLSDVLIPLHPLAIAGFFGLLVNAVNLLPLGRTDGGRVGLALFGRTGLQVAGFLTSLGLLIQGLFGSDILLFFFSFVVFFQGEMEIPQRNEVDDIDFSRVLLATGAGVLVLLTLIPM